MSAHPQGGHYDDGYGHQGQAQGQGQGQGQHAQQGQDAYYHDDQYSGQYHDDQRGGYQDQHGHGDAYYDESYVSSPA